MANRARAFSAHYRDPGSTKLGEALRERSSCIAKRYAAATSEMLLYMASRAQLVDEVLRPALLNATL